MMDYKELLLQFIASLTLADHLGDVTDDIDFVLKKLDIDVEWDDLESLGDRLGEMDITTLYGTSMSSED